MPGKSKATGKIIVRAEAVQESNQTYHMSFTWANAGNVTSGCCGSTVNPVKFQFHRKVGANWVPTYSTPNVVNPNDPQSGLLKIPMTLLCNSDSSA